MIYIDNDTLKEFYNMSDDDISSKTVKELLALEDDMKKQKASDESKRNAKDNEYIRLVRKYFTPYKFLRQWFTDEEIILACSRHMHDRNIVEEYKTPHQSAPYPDAEFITTRAEYIPQYLHGHELAEKKLAKCNIYRVKNQYQGLRHGAVILDLLYSKYPQLKKYEFNAYEYYGYKTTGPYDIYPNNRILAPFEALMDKNVEAIIKRNIDYAASYNNGLYSPDKMKELLNSDKIKEFFNTIQNM